MTKPIEISDSLFQDLRSLIIEARQDVARQVNSALVLLYWQVGRRIRQDILKEKRADYGEKIVSTLSTQLIKEFGMGFDEKNLRRMVQFAEVFCDEQIVVTLSRQLSWSHFVAIIPLDDDLKRDFYAEMCRIERWSVRTLRQKISGMLFERTALSKKPMELAKQELIKLREEDKLTPDLVFRGPYFLDFHYLLASFCRGSSTRPSCWPGLVWKERTENKNVSKINLKEERSPKKCRNSATSPEP